MQKTAIFGGLYLLLSTRGASIMLLILLYLNEKPLRENGIFGGEGVVLYISNPFPRRGMGLGRGAAYDYCALVRANDVHGASVLFGVNCA